MTPLLIPRVMWRLSGLVLVLVLLLGQATLLAHEYDFAAHTGADCSVCLHATPLSDAAAGLFSVELPLADNTATFHPLTRRPLLIITSFYRARAPPATPSL